MTVDAVPGLGRARWTSCGRTPRTPRTPTSPTAWGAPCAAAPRWCCPRRTTARSPRPERAGCGWSSRASPCRRGSTCPAALAVGLAVVSALDLLPAPLDAGLDALADLLDAEAERNQPGHEPFMNPAKSLALRLDGHTPLLWGTDAAGRGRRRPRRRRAGGARRGGRARRRRRPRGPGGRPAPRARRGRPRARHLPRPLRRRPRRARGRAAAARAARHGRRRARAGGAAAHRPRLAVHRPAAPRRGGAPRRPRTRRCCAPRCWPPGSTSRRSTSAWPPARSSPPDRRSGGVVAAARRRQERPSWSCWTTPCAPTRGGRAP